MRKTHKPAAAVVPREPHTVFTPPDYLAVELNLKTPVFKNPMEYPL